MPTDLLPHEGVLRFTLSSNCPTTLTIVFGVDGFLFGPATLSPGKSQDYQLREGVHTTSGKTTDGARTFPVETKAVLAGQRVVRVLSCG